MTKTSTSFHVTTATETAEGTVSTATVGSFPTIAKAFAAAKKAAGASRSAQMQKRGEDWQVTGKTCTAWVTR